MLANHLYVIVLVLQLLSLVMNCLWRDPNAPTDCSSMKVVRLPGHYLPRYGVSKDACTTCRSSHTIIV